ncbi:phosphoglycerate mutase family protein [Paenibacillus qinlingensis]|uniref:2,3-bisphosphoglycerate-dependent phosphoglycerate mutase n=1 Tax=Paenibacillus qinlingensis TaxID=1837343 RepID=A0ABU1NWG9_9BACL|nr:phosphoglycerate mutase family protein [Paenibacillus qinlingensis]MDR6551798.1 2,3-bisphosphoglycerate-dependent phosphoglycerate mutase [Paenibacillus qinlingensis]
MMEILVIRHGESEDEKVNVLEPLTSLGIKQSKKMSARVSKEFPPEVIWSSTLQRARQTADILASIVDCEVRYLDNLCEQEVDESDIKFYERIKQIFSYIKENSSQYKRVAIVSHGGTITKLIENFLQLPSNNNVWFHTNNTGIHFLHYHPKADILKFSNSTCHLN